MQSYPDQPRPTLRRTSLSALVFLSACGSLFEPRPTERDPVWLASETCTSWSPHAPRHDRIVVDLTVFGPDYLETMPGPTEAQREAVRREGGSVLHSFHVRIIRAELDTAAIRRLIFGPNRIANMATAVRDPDDRRVDIQIEFSRRVTDQHLQTLRFAHFAIERVDEPFHVVARVDDAWLPLLKGMPDVRFVRAQEIICGYAT
jgi:hypothetical protein